MRNMLDLFFIHKHANRAAKKTQPNKNPPKDRKKKKVNDIRQHKFNEFKKHSTVLIFYSQAF